MVKRVTGEEAAAWLNDYFKRQPDIGLRKALVSLVFRPRNPFAPEKRRLPKRGFLFGACIFLSAVAWFIYFNLVR